MTEIMYQLENTTKVYKKKNETVKALNEVNLIINRGEFVTIQGSTGGGKSTLLQMLGGLDVPTTGQVTFDGQNLAKSSAGKLSEVRGKRIGFVFQAFNLIPTLTAQENVEMGLVPLKVPAKERHARAKATLEAVGLGERRNHYPGEMSGGQQQRVAIARALVKNPDVILADEPTGNLDEEMRDEVFAILEDLWENKGLTLIVVTHDRAIADRGSHQIRLKHGKIQVEERTIELDEALALDPEEFAESQA